MKLRDLLPLPLRGTRYTQLMDAGEELLRQFKAEKIDRFLHKYDYELSDDENLAQLLKTKGETPFTYGGYSDTRSYIERKNKIYQALRRFRSTTSGYDKIMELFFYKGGAYPMRVVDDNLTFGVIRNPLEGTSGATESVTDNDGDYILYYDGGVPVPNPPQPSGLPPLYMDTPDLIQTLDNNEVRDFTNHFCIEYSPLVTESETVLISEGSSRSFYENVTQSKRLKEVAHFQVFLDWGIGTTTLTDYKLEVNADVDVVAYGGFDGIDSFSIGDARHSDTTGIADVQNLVFGPAPTQTYLTTNEQSASVIDMEWSQFEYSKLPFSEFSEIMFFSGTTPILYLGFPMIQFWQEMYSSFRVRVK